MQIKFSFKLRKLKKRLFNQNTFLAPVDPLPIKSNFYWWNFVFYFCIKTKNIKHVWNDDTAAAPAAVAMQ